MKRNKSILFLITMLVFLRCSSDDDTYSFDANIGCNESDISLIYGTWSEPSFISNSTNCANECVVISFVINADSTYQLDYKIFNNGPLEPDIEISDKRSYEIVCLDARNNGWRGGIFRTIEWNFNFDSDSISQYEWLIKYSSLEGMILEPEILDLTGEAYVRLRKI